MKKILLLSFLFVTVAGFTGCKNEEDDLFSSSAAQRLAASKATYTQRLSQAVNGWVMEYYPTNDAAEYTGNCYLMMLKFNADGTVVAAGNKFPTGKGYNNTLVQDTSNWQVIADQGPVLTFNTYNECIHYFSNPASYNLGNGFEGDYEFEISSLDENAQFAMLKGKKTSTYNRLTRLDRAEDFKSYLNSITSFQDSIFTATAPNYNILTLGDSSFVIKKAYTTFMNVYPVQGDSVTQTTVHPFGITKRDNSFYLRFRDKLALNKDVAEQEFVFDAATCQFVGVTNSVCKISGYPKVEFLKETVGAKHKYQLQSKSSMSSAMQTYINALVAELKDHKRTFDYLQLKMDDSGSNYVWKLSFSTLGSSHASTTRDYLVTTTGSGSSITMNYTSPSDDAANMVLTSMPSLKDVLTGLSGDFTISANTTDFDLSEMKFTSVKNPDLWFVLKYVK